MIKCSSILKVTDAREENCSCIIEWHLAEHLVVLVLQELKIRPNLITDFPTAAKEDAKLNLTIREGELLSLHFVKWYKNRRENRSQFTPDPDRQGWG